MTNVSKVLFSWVVRCVKGIGLPGRKVRRVFADAAVSDFRNLDLGEPFRPDEIDRWLFERDQRQWITDDGRVIRARK